MFLQIAPLVVQPWRERLATQSGGNLDPKLHSLRNIPRGKRLPGAEQVSIPKSTLFVTYRALSAYPEWRKS